MDSSVSPKDEIWFLRVCHHISNAVYFQQSCKSLRQHIRSTHFKSGLLPAQLQVTQATR